MREVRENILHVARDEILTDYVKHLIFEWEQSGSTLVELERAAGTRSNGHFSQLKSGKLGAGETVVRYLAKALNKTPKQIREEAYEYHEREGAKLKSQAAGEVSDDGLRDALVAVKAVGATDEQAIRSAISRWGNMIGTGMSREFWFQKIGDEQRLIEDARGRERVHRKEKRGATKKRKKIRDVKEQIATPPAPKSTRAVPHKRPA